MDEVYDGKLGDRLTTRAMSESNLSASHRSKPRRTLSRSVSLSNIRSQKLADEMREHIATLKREVEKERNAAKQVKREKVLEIKNIRDAEVHKTQQICAELELRYKTEKDQEIRRERESLQREFDRELQRICKQKDDEIRLQQENWLVERENLVRQERDQVRRETRDAIYKETNLVRAKLEADLRALQEEHEYLKQELNLFREADRNRAGENRRISEEHKNEIARLQKDAMLDSRRQLGEIRDLQRVIEKLEAKLGFEEGTVMRLQMEKESLDDALSRLKQADALDKKSSKSYSSHAGAGFDLEAMVMDLPPRLASKPHNDPERVLHRKNVELGALVRRLDERNQQIAAKNNELVEELNAVRNSFQPLEEKNKRTGQKNMELNQTVRRLESRVKEMSAENSSKEEKIVHLQALVDKKDKQLRKVKKTKAERELSEAQVEEFEDVQRQLCEQLQIIAELRQQTIEKDRRIDVLKKRQAADRQSLKQSSRKSRSLQSLDSLATHEASDGNDDLLDGTKSEDGDILFEESVTESNENKRRIARLTKEHMELQHAYTLLQQSSGGTTDPERAALEKDSLQSELMVARARITELERSIDQQKNLMASADELRQQAQDSCEDMHAKLISAESDLVHKTIQLKQMTEDLKETMDQNDLLEFRIAELEEMTKPRRPSLDALRLTEEDRAEMTTDIDDVDCDALSVRMDLKEMEINRLPMLTRKERRTLAQARALVDKGARDIQVLHDTEAVLRRRIDDVENKYNDAKQRIQEQEEELHRFQKGKLLQEEVELFDTKSGRASLLASRRCSADVGVIGNRDAGEVISEANQRIVELERIVAALEEKLRKATEISVDLSAEELEILQKKVEQLRDAEKQVNILTAANEDLRKRLEEFQKHGNSHRCLEATTINPKIPEDLANEIRLIKEENEKLHSELGVLRGRAQDALDLAEKAKLSLRRDERATQTPQISPCELSRLACAAMLQFDPFRAAPPRAVAPAAGQKDSATEPPVTTQGDVSEPTVAPQDVTLAERASKLESTKQDSYTPSPPDLDATQLHEDEAFIQSILQKYGSSSPMEATGTDTKPSEFDIYLNETEPQLTPRSDEVVQDSSRKTSRSTGSSAHSRGSFDSNASTASNWSTSASRLTVTAPSPGLLNYGRERLSSDASYAGLFPRQMTSIPADILDHINQTQNMHLVDDKLDADAWSSDVRSLATSATSSAASAQPRTSVSSDGRVAGNSSMPYCDRNPSPSPAVVSKHDMVVLASASGSSSDRSDNVVPAPMAYRQATASLDIQNAGSSPRYSSVPMTIEFVPQLPDSTSRQGIPSDQRSLLDASLPEEFKLDFPSPVLRTAVNHPRLMNGGRAISFLNEYDGIPSPPRASPDSLLDRPVSSSESLPSNLDPDVKELLDYGDALGRRGGCASSYLGRSDSDSNNVSHVRDAKIATRSKSPINRARSLSEPGFRYGMRSASPSSDYSRWTSHSPASMSHFSGHKSPRIDSGIGSMAHFGASQYLRSEDAGLSEPVSDLATISNVASGYGLGAKIELPLSKAACSCMHSMPVSSNLPSRAGVQSASVNTVTRYSQSTDYRAQVSAPPHASDSRPGNADRSSWSPSRCHASASGAGCLTCQLAQQCASPDPQLEPKFETEFESKLESKFESNLESRFDASQAASQNVTFTPSPAPDLLPESRELLKSSHMLSPSPCKPPVHSSPSPMLTANSKCTSGLSQIKHLPALPSSTWQSKVAKQHGIASGFAHPAECCDSPQDEASSSFSDLADSTSGVYEEPCVHVHDTISTSSKQVSASGVHIARRQPQLPVRERAREIVYHRRARSCSPPKPSRVSAMLRLSDDSASTIVDPHNSSNGSCYLHRERSMSESTVSTIASEIDLPMARPFRGSSYQDVHVSAQHRHHSLPEVPRATSLDVSTRFAPLPSSPESSIDSLFGIDSRKSTRAPPPVLPKPKDIKVTQPAKHLTKRRARLEELCSTAALSSRPAFLHREQLIDVGNMNMDGLRRELCRVREECASYERQLKQKEHVIHEMHSELKEEIEGIAMVERKEKEIQMKAETIQQITEILQKTRKELELKTKECLRREAECKQLKLELKTCVDEKKRVEFQLSEQQINISKYESMETRMSQISERYDEALAHNKELMERIKSLEIAEREFIELERNVIDLQVQLRDFEDVEVHRDELFQKLQAVKKQRDEFLEKGRIVEEERNEFVKSNKTLEQYLIEWKRKSEQFKKTNSKLKERILSLERDKKELEDRVLEIQSERTAMQSRISKLEMEYEDLLRELREVTMERNALDQRLADCEDMLSDHDHLEEGFHSLRLKLAELSRQRDDAEMLVPSYKTKLHLLRKQVREKENTIVQMEHELKALKYAVHNSTIEDITKIKSIGNSSSDSYSRVDKQEKQFADDYTTTGSSDSYQVVHRRRHQKLRPGRRYVALFDYDPYKSSTSDHPERELKLREGDYVTVYGEVDMDGFLEAEVDGVRGLVPSIYVEETSSDEGVDIEIDKSSNVRHRERKFVALYDYDPYTMGTTDRPDMQHSLRKGEVVSVYGDVDVDGYYTCYKNGKRALIPSNFVEVYSSGRHQSSSAHAQTSSRHHQHGQHASGSSSFKGTIEIDRDDVLGPPFAPRDLKVLRVVTKRAVLLGWDLPSMDELGKSNGVQVVGYQIWVNGREKQEVRSSTMNKCLVDNVDLEGRVEFSIQTIAENGFRSEKCHFAITGALAALGEDVGSSSDSGSYKRYVALYDYDPFKSSPNPNPSLELALREGDLVKVFDTSRSDGFYHAEVHGKRGLVPSNFIQRISGSSSTHQASSSVHQSYQQESDSNSRRVSFKH